MRHWEPRVRWTTCTKRSFRWCGRRSCSRRDWDSITSLQLRIVKGRVMNYSIRHALLLVVGLMVMVGCGTDSATGPPADYTLSLTPGTLTITQGASGTMNVGIVRSNFTGAITLRLSGAPPGISGSFDPSAPTETSSTLTLNVVGAVDPGTYHLSVNGSAIAGNRSTALTVIVKLKPSAGNAARLVAGSGYSCFLDVPGQAYCWGRGGSLGDGTTTDRLVP